MFQFGNPLKGLTLDHAGVIAGILASLVVTIAALRKVQLAMMANPRFAQFRAAIMGVVKVFQHPDGSRTERLIRSVKTEILDANEVSDKAIFARIDSLAIGHQELAAQTVAMSEANEQQHSAVGIRLGALTSEVSEVKIRLESVERKLP